MLRQVVDKVKMLAQFMGGTIKVGLSLEHPYLDPAIDLMSPIAPHLYNHSLGSHVKYGTVDSIRVHLF